MGWTIMTMSMNPSTANPRRANQGRAGATDVAAGATVHTADTPHLDWAASSTTDSTDLATDMGQGTIVIITGPTDIPSFRMVDTNISPSTRVNLPNLLTTNPSHMPPLNLKPTLLLSPSLMLPLNPRPTQLPRLMLPHNLNPTCSLLHSTRPHNLILTLSLLHNMRLPPHPLQRHIHNLNMPNHTLHVC